MISESERTVVIFESQQNLEDAFTAAARLSKLRILGHVQVDKINFMDERYVALTVAIVGRVNGIRSYVPVELIKRLRQKNPGVSIVNATGDELDGAGLDVSRTQMNFPALVDFLSKLV